MPESVRLIKKYPNRRLYDTKTSAYITLSDVKELVLSAKAFKVLDARTGDDLTRSILLQIILEEEATVTEPLFGTALLTQLIRCHGQATQGMLGKYLEMNVKLFSDFQKKHQEHSHSLRVKESVEDKTEQWSQLSHFVNSHGPNLLAMLASGMNQSRKNTMPENSIDESRRTNRSDK